MVKSDQIQKEADMQEDQGTIKIWFKGKEE